jgi:hypothetical protein
MTYKIYFSNRAFGPKTSTSLQTTLATEAHLREGQFLLTEQTLNNNNSIQFNSIQFNSLLFMCRVNSYKANYRHSTV